MAMDRKKKRKFLLWGIGTSSVCLFFTNWWVFGLIALICLWYNSLSDGKSFKAQFMYGSVAVTLIVTSFVIYTITFPVFKNTPAPDNIAQSPAPQQPAQPTKETKTHEEALAEYVGSWRTTTQRSKIDDSQNVIIGLQADEPIQTPYKGMVYPKLMIRCAENKTSMIVSFDMFLNNDKTKVTYRIDKEKAKTVRWNVTSDFDSLYIPNPIPLIRQLKDEDQIYIQVTPYGQGTISANFYVHGLSNAIKPIQEACGWGEAGKAKIKREVNLKETSFTRGMSKSLKRYEPMMVKQSNGHIYIQLPQDTITDAIYNSVIQGGICLDKAFNEDRSWKGIKGFTVMNRDQSQGFKFDGAEKECEVVNNIKMGETAKIIHERKTACSDDCL